MRRGLGKEDLSARISTQACIMPKMPKKLVPFKAGQTWVYEWHYDWASFGDQPPQHEKIYIVKRTKAMITYKKNGGDMKRVKIQTDVKGVKGNERFNRELVGYYNNELMKLL